MQQLPAAACSASLLAWQTKSGSRPLAMPMIINRQLHVEKKYLLEKPKGVRGRSSDNQKILKDLNWSPPTSLKDGLALTYKWIYNQIKSGENTSKFIKA